MNRISSFFTQQTERTQNYARPTQRLREDTESRLRDMAYVLALTSRIKAEILEDRDATPGMSA